MASRLVAMMRTDHQRADTQRRSCPLVVSALPQRERCSASLLSRRSGSLDELEQGSGPASAWAPPWLPAILHTTTSLGGCRTASFGPIPAGLWQSDIPLGVLDCKRVQARLMDPISARWACSV
uniref:Uncharacterized protein n=1 Tax=Myotis myotis TaxID=51298 RepID=A0A7J7VZ43_MYOMY|nr:hypothetical protein mMyoMyo1_012258 [Myotis myotis]